MKHYDVHIDGYRLTNAARFGLAALGFCFGWVGVLVDWAIGHGKHQMECSAEDIYLGIFGWALSVVCWFVLTAAGVLSPGASLVALVACGGSAVFAGAAGATLGAAAPIDGWAIFLLVVACLFLVLSSLWIYGMRFKMTPEEKAAVLPGDDWIKPGERHLRYDSGVTIDAPAAKVWAYVKQSGQTQAGWYSFDWLERLFTFDIHNHYDIHPEWQNLKAGDYQWFHQAPLSIGEWVTEVSDVEPYGWASHSDTATDPSYKHRGPNGEAALKLWFRRFCWTWNWQVASVPGDPSRCRLIWRCDCTFDRWHRANKYFVVFILGTASIVMGRGYMNRLKSLAEGTYRYPDSKK